MSKKQSIRNKIIIFAVTAIMVFSVGMLSACEITGLSLEQRIANLEIEVSTLEANAETMGTDALFAEIERLHGIAVSLQDEATSNRLCYRIEVTQNQLRVLHSNRMGDVNFVQNLVYGEVNFRYNSVYGSGMFWDVSANPALDEMRVIRTYEEKQKYIDLIKDAWFSLEYIGFLTERYNQEFFVNNYIVVLPLTYGAMSCNSHCGINWFPARFTPTGITLGGGITLTFRNLSCTYAVSAGVVHWQKIIIELSSNFTLEEFNVTKIAIEHNEGGC